MATWEIRPKRLADNIYSSSCGDVTGPYIDWVDCDEKYATVFEVCMDSEPVLQAKTRREAEEHIAFHLQPHDEVYDEHRHEIVFVEGRVMNWDSPEDRLALIERVGAEEYTRLIVANDTVVHVGGRAIRPIVSPLDGLLFVVGGTGYAFATLAEAERYAKENPKDG